MDDPIVKKIRLIISEHLDVTIEEVTDEASLVDGLGADSLDLSEIIMTIEDEFGFLLSDEEAAEIKTVGDAISFFSNRMIFGK